MVFLNRGYVEVSNIKIKNRDNKQEKCRKIEKTIKLKRTVHKSKKF